MYLLLPAKNGSRGQFVWGSKINNQAIMVALVEFCKDRRREIEYRENELARKKAETGYARNENLIKDIVTGVQNTRKEREKQNRTSRPSVSYFHICLISMSPWCFGKHGEAIKRLYVRFMAKRFLL